MTNKEDSKPENNVIKVEYVQQDSVQLPDYSYGNGQQQLNYDNQVRNKPNTRRFIFLNM